MIKQNQLIFSFRSTIHIAETGQEAIFKAQAISGIP